MSQVTTNSGDKNQDEKLLMPFTYIQQVPGKQIRSKLSLAFNYWLRVSDEKLRAIGEIVQMLHNSSLLQQSWIHWPHHLEFIKSNVPSLQCCDVNNTFSEVLDELS